MPNGEVHAVNGYRVGLLTEGTPDEAEGLAGRCPVFRIDPIT